MAYGFTMTGPASKPSQDFLDEQDWTRKKRKQEADMAIARQRAFPRPERDPSTGGALGIGGLGKQVNAVPTAKPTTYPTPADLPKYNSLAEKQQAQKDAFANIQKPGFGMGYSVKPNVPQKPIDDMGGLGIASPNTSSAPTPENEIQPTYQEGESTGSILKGDGGGKRPGLSIDNNAAVAQPLAPAMGGGNSGFGFRVMPPPRKAYGEDSRRQALAMDIKPYKNGMGLTTGQVALKNSILNGDDEKYANEQYQGQLSAAQKMAQEGMQQAGENSRAQLTESGANSRANNQLGFDAEKFQQLAALDSRKLDMQQSNDKVANYAPKKLNQLREAWFKADEEGRSAIEEQMSILTAGSKDAEDYWTAISGGETLSDDGLTASKNPDTLLNRRSGEVRQQPKGERSFSDPYMVALQARTDISMEEKEKLANNYLDGGEV